MTIDEIRERITEQMLANMSLDLGSKLEMIPPMTQEEACARARAGAQVLDRDRDDWFEDVNVNTLQISSPYLCMLAQVYEHFNVGVDRLFEQFRGELPFGGTDEMGFACSPLDDDVMRLAWKWEIEGRKLAKEAMALSEGERLKDEDLALV